MNKEYDKETGFYYFLNRYYNPQTGRFIQVDPMPNWDKSSYAYCINNPLRYKDPLGTKTAYIPEEIYYATHEEEIKRQKWFILARLSQLDPEFFGGKWWYSRREMLTRGVIEWLMTTRLYKEYSFFQEIVWMLWKKYWKRRDYIVFENVKEYGYGPLTCLFIPSEFGNYIIVSEEYLKLPSQIAFWLLILSLPHEAAHEYYYKGENMTQLEYHDYVTAGWLVTMVIYLNYWEDMPFHGEVETSIMELWDIYYRGMRAGLGLSPLYKEIYRREEREWPGGP